MAIIRIVETDVYCDICGEWITGWRSKETGVSKEWAKTFAREKGCTAGCTEGLYSDRNDRQQSGRFSKSEIDKCNQKDG